MGFHMFGDPPASRPPHRRRPLPWYGLPLGAVPAPPNHRNDGLLTATLDALTVVGPLPERPVVQLDASYDYQPRRQAWPNAG